MTSKQFRDIMGQLGASQSAVARLLGVPQSTANKWATGTERPHGVPETAARFLRLLVAAKITPKKASVLLGLEEG